MSDNITNLKDLIRFLKIKIKNLEKERDQFKDLYLESERELDKYKPNIEKKIKNKCLICLDEIKDLYITKCCNNKFNKKCIEKWLKKSKTCPICKKYI